MQGLRGNERAKSFIQIAVGRRNGEAKIFLKREVEQRSETNEKEKKEKESKSMIKERERERKRGTVPKELLSSLSHI